MIHSDPEEQPIPSVSAIIPAYRDLHLLAESIPALLASEGVELDVIVVNNDVAQDVASWVRERGFGGVRVFDAGWNSGFAAANNRGIREASGDYIFFCNNDLVVTAGYLAELVRAFEAHPRAGAAAGKLLRYDLPNRRQLRRFDSAGIALRRNRGAFDRGENLEDCGQFDTAEEVFGVTAAAMLVRREALEDIDRGGGFFDENLFMYKEDVDVAWRLRLRGWESWYVPAAVAYHARTSQGLAGKGYLADPAAYLRTERSKPTFVRMHSLKNQWLLLVKHEGAASLVRDLPWIVQREVLAFVSALVLSPATLASAVAGFVRALPRAIRDRRRLQATAIVPPAAIRARWAGR